MTVCNNNQKFKTAEAASKAILRTNRVIDEFLNIKNLSEFRRLNGLWSDSAKERFGIQEKLFLEDNNRAIPNKKAFKNIDNAKGINYQKKGTEGSIASPQTIARLKDFIKRIGVDIKSVPDIVVGGVKQDVNGVAQLMQGLIQVVNGKESESLPEEAMHFAVAIIKQTNPTLYKKLMSEINGYEILNTVFNTYGSDPLYQTSDGKRDVVRLKEETIAKLLTEVVIKRAEGITEKPALIDKTNSWWNSIITYLKELFQKSGFDQAAMDILSGKNIGTASIIKEQENAIFLQKDKQTIVIDQLDAMAAKITKKEDQPNEADNGYYIDGKKIGRRVTDLVHDWYLRKFKNNDLVKTDYEKAVDELKAEKGTAGHAAFEYAFGRLVDENGYIRPTMLDDGDYEITHPNFSRTMYDILKENLQDRLTSFPAGTRFKTEITVYNAKRNLAGTIDFLAVEPSGKIHILDWKFMNLNVTKYLDIPWYKIAAWNTQMTEYVRILKDAYNVEPNNIGQARMIPILTIYSQGTPTQNILPKLLEIKIGAVNPKEIEDDYLLPVGIESEKTGNTKIDKLVEKLLAEYNRLSDKTVLPSERVEKAHQLNTLFKGIRHLQMKGDLRALLYQAKILNLGIQRLIEKYNDIWKGQDPTLFTEQQRSDMYQEIDESRASISIYTNLYSDLKSLFDGSTTKEDKKLKKDLRKTSEIARDFETEIITISDDFTAEHIAKSENVNDYLTPEKIIKGFTKWFSTTATLQSRSLRILFKKANRALGFAAMDTLGENRKLATLKDNFDVWAKSKGLGVKNYFDIIKKKDKNELINEYDSKFYPLLKSKINEKDFQWIRDNINVSEYNKFLKEHLEEETQRILNRSDIYTIVEQEAIDTAKDTGVINLGKLPYQVRITIERARLLHDTSTTESAGWLMYESIKKFPKSLWISEEWKELTKPENKVAKDLYDYIREKNNEYKALGYISKAEARVFLPFVRKGLTEKIITGGDIRFGEQFLRNISIDEGDIGYGKIDPISGEPIDSIPKYFTNEIEGELSTDLFKTMSMYNEAALRYKYVKQIEYQVIALVNTERNKKAIMTSSWGKTQREENGDLKLTPDNNENSKLVKDMMKAIIYDQRYIESEVFDQLLGKVGTWGKTFNEKLGIKIFPEDLSDRQISVNKIVTQLNNTFQLNTLGLNLLSASSNLFGGNAQSLINAGIYFTKTDYLAAEGTIFINKFNGTDKKKMLGALEYFLPLTENYNRELAKKLSIATMTAESLQDGLMYFMRQSDWNVQTANFYAYLRNTIVQDGQILNARLFLRTQDKYTNRYAGTTEERKANDAEFEKDVKALIEEKGIMKIAVIEDGKFSIPGVEQKSESVIDLRRKVQQINKDALGNLTPEDLRTINMQIYGKSFMVFKNWIPRLVDVRLGGMKYNSASDAYEWGRVRTVFKIIGEDLLGSIGNLRNSMIANDKGVEFMRELYEQKKIDYLKDTGKVLNLTEDQFIDIVRSNIKNQIFDVLFLCTILSLIVGLKVYTPDKDEDPHIKNSYAFMLKAIDKFQNELSYFYDPTSITQLVGKGIFPSITLIENFSKFTKNFFIENWAIGTGNEDLEKSNKVIKYLMKSFPFTNQMIGYLPMMYPQMAKDLGVVMQSNYGIR